MNTKLTIATAIFAGLTGGVLTRYIAPPVAFAQNAAPAPKEIRAQTFTFVDASDRPVGTFSAIPSPNGMIPMRIVLKDPNGREIWSAGGSLLRPGLTEK